VCLSYLFLSDDDDEVELRKEVYVVEFIKILHLGTCESAKWKYVKVTINGNLIITL